MRPTRRLFAIGGATAAVACALAVLASAVAGPPNGRAAPEPRPLAQARAAGLVLAVAATGFSSSHLAVQTSADLAVRAFAERMADDNAALIAEARAVLERLGVQPVESGATRDLEERARQTLTRLATLRGADFDREYVAEAIVAQGRLLRILDEALAAPPRNVEVVTLLVQVRSLAKDGLARAERLQATAGHVVRTSRRGDASSTRRRVGGSAGLDRSSGRGSATRRPADVKRDSKRCRSRRPGARAAGRPGSGRLHHGIKDRMGKFLTGSGLSGLLFLPPESSPFDIP